MKTSAAPHNVVLPRPPTDDKQVVNWAWNLTRELDNFFRDFQAVRGLFTPRSGAPFVVRGSVVNAASGSPVQFDSMSIDLISTVDIPPDAPALLRAGDPGQVAFVTNGGDFSITIASGITNITISQGASVILRWSVNLARWMKIA